MLSVFPTLLSYEQLAPFILRMMLGITLAYFGYQKILGKGGSSGSNTKIYGGIEVLISVFLIIGLWTQVAALVNAVILVVKIGFKIRHKEFLTNGVNYYLLLLAMAVSVMFLGAGWFAFDMPL
ncbi:MAG: DoxX family protein [Candidatus Pacebacteria bacterium]|nr:DoxX family protein [Candidatus Paceibacterota bacterium]